MDPVGLGVLKPDFLKQEAITTPLDTEYVEPEATKDSETKDSETKEEEKNMFDEIFSELKNTINTSKNLSDKAKTWILEAL